MAGNRITWNIGFYNPDIHYVYRSDAPMDTNNLPTPLTTLGAGISVYEDTDNIVEDNTYYYRVDSEKMGLYIPGYEISITPSSATTDTFDIFEDGSAVALFQFNNSLNDINSNYSFTYNNGTASYGSSFVKNGTGAFVQDSTGSEPSLETNITLPSTGFSISGWFFFTENKRADLFSFGNYTNGLWTEPDGFKINNGSVFSNSTQVNYSIPLNTPMFIVYTFDGSTGTLFLDKTSLGSGSSSNSFGTGFTVIGRGNYGQSQGTGSKVDQLRMFNRVINQSEIDMLYQEGTGV